MGISLGLVGLGQFGQAFADMFMAHPAVDRIALCDREADRMDQFADKESWKKKFDRKDMYPDLDAICKSDLDALVVITQPWLHAPQCIQAMESGKHVYSAVPIISIPDGVEIEEWCGKLIDTCKSTGKSYMLGETTYYRPQTMFCMKKAAEGAFGDFVYAEGEYFHDVDANCNLREVKASRLNSAAGQEWIEIAKTYKEKGIKSGPMHYPTHSTCGPVAVMNAHAVKVTAYPYYNANNDEHFGEGAITNETALFKMSNGATVRICECREIAGSFADSETFRVMGTSGTYAENVWKENKRTAPLTAVPLEKTELSDDEMRDPLPEEVAQAFQAATEPDADPDSDFVPTGHGGSHPYLVHEFCDAVANNRQPAINIWEASRYMMMGVMAHRSALKDGETLDVPDFGDAPE